MYEKPKVEVVEIHLNECIAGSGAVGVKMGQYEDHKYGVGNKTWDHKWL